MEWSIRIGVPWLHYPTWTFFVQEEKICLPLGERPCHAQNEEPLKRKFVQVCEIYRKEGNHYDEHAQKIPLIEPLEFIRDSFEVEGEEEDEEEKLEVEERYEVSVVETDEAHIFY